MNTDTVTSKLSVSSENYYAVTLMTVINDIYDKLSFWNDIFSKAEGATVRSFQTGPYSVKL